MDRLHSRLQRIGAVHHFGVELTHLFVDFFLHGLKTFDHDVYFIPAVVLPARDHQCLAVTPVRRCRYVFQNVPQGTLHFALEQHNDERAQNAISQHRNADQAAHFVIQNGGVWSQLQGAQRNLAVIGLHKVEYPGIGVVVQLRVTGFKYSTDVDPQPDVPDGGLLLDLRQLALNHQGFGFPHTDGQQG